MQSVVHEKATVEFPTSIRVCRKLQNDWQKVVLFTIHCGAHPGVQSGGLPATDVGANGQHNGQTGKKLTWAISVFDKTIVSQP